MMKVSMLLVAAAACASVAMARGGPKGPRGPLPQSCADDKAEHKACLEQYLSDNGVDLDARQVMADVKVCMEPCRDADSSSAGDDEEDAEREARREALEEFKDCIKTQAGDVKTCVDEEVAAAGVEVAERDDDEEGRPHGRRGHGKGHGKGKGKGKGKGQGRGGPADHMRRLLAKAEECGVTACIDAAVGAEWAGKKDELIDIVAQAPDACPRPSSEECAADKEAVRAAAETCMLEHAETIAAAKTECTTPELEAIFAEREAHRGGRGNGRGKGQRQGGNGEAQGQRQANRQGGKGQGKGGRRGDQ